MKLSAAFCLFLMCMVTHAQDTVYISKRLSCSMYPFPDTKEMIHSFYDGETYNIRAAVSADPALNRLFSVYLTETNQQAAIQKHSRLPDVFSVSLNALRPDSAGGLRIDLQYWIRPVQGVVLMYPVAVDSLPVFDSQGNVMEQQVQWKPVSELSPGRNGRYLIGSVMLYVKPKMERRRRKV